MLTYIFTRQCVKVEYLNQRHLLRLFFNNCFTHRLIVVSVWFFKYSGGCDRVARSFFVTVLKRLFLTGVRRGRLIHRRELGAMDLSWEIWSDRLRNGDLFRVVSRGWLRVSRRWLRNPWIIVFLETKHISRYSFLSFFSFILFVDL